jgi:hypothetical protein
VRYRDRARYTTAAVTNSKMINPPILNRFGAVFRYGFMSTYGKASSTFDVPERPMNKYRPQVGSSKNERDRDATDVRGTHSSGTTYISMPPTKEPP